MDISEHLRDPIGATVFAGLATAAYIYMKARMNNEPKPELNAYTKPSILVAILVYFIVSNGAACKETISVDPF